MDCSIVPSKKYKELCIASTTDFFFPLVQDPYLQGQIGAANVLSDMYALGVYEVDTVLMILAASLNMLREERMIVTELMMKGFIDKCKEAGTEVTGGQSILNPWAIIGGVAKSVTKISDLIGPPNFSKKIEVGDVMLLTKPLGTQVSVNLWEWKLESEQKENRFLKKLNEAKKFSDEEIRRMYKVAVGSMVLLNRTASKLLHKHGAIASTDVTGFGVIGHADNLMINQNKEQKVPLKLVLDTLPIIRGTEIIDSIFPKMFRLMDGLSAETSGGLLVVLPKEKAQSFINDYEKETGWPCVQVGTVVSEKEFGAVDARHSRTHTCIPKNVKVISV